MTKSDNFFDISGTADEDAAVGKGNTVDFDVFGDATSVETAAENVDLGDTAAFPRTPSADDPDLDFDMGPAVTNETPTPITPAPTESVASETAPESGQRGTLWMIVALVAAAAAAAWWLLG